MSKGKAGKSKEASLEKAFEADLRTVVEETVTKGLEESMKAADFPAIWQMLKTHDKILRGNGRPGLVEEMAVTKPMVAKLEAHLKAFNEFESQTKVDRQAFFSRFDSIEKTVGDGLNSLKKAIEPITKIYKIMIQGGVAIAFAGALIGGFIVFIFEHAEKIKEILKWTTTK